MHYKLNLCIGHYKNYKLNARYYNPILKGFYPITIYKRIFDYLTFTYFHANVKRKMYTREDTDTSSPYSKSEILISL